MLLDNHIGMGKAQYRQILAIAILILCEGAETIAIGFMLPVLKQYFHLTTIELAIGLTLINIGLPLGSFLQSFSDNYGRAPFVFLDAVILIVFGLLSAISWSFFSFVVFRFFYEIGIGFCLPLVSAMTSEISPANQRG